MKPPQHTPPLAVLVGAGPGAPGLITQEGAKWLSRADVLLYDNLVHPSLLRLAPETAERIYVGKVPGRDSMTQEQITALLVGRCRPGRVVVRLKGGDPLVFGRGGEETDALAEAKIPFRIVPGVTAGVAAGAFAGIPLTDRRAAAAVAFVTGHEDPAKAVSRIDWDALARIDTLVFYMGVGNAPEIAARLMAAGRAGETPVALIERATTPRQRTVTATLATTADEAKKAAIRPPAIILVGEVAKMHHRLAWLEQLPLFGRCVLITRPPQQAAELAERLGELGAEVIEAPAVAIEPPEGFAGVDAALRRLREFDWLVLTSVNGVEALTARMAELGLDARALAGVKVAAVGEPTAAALGDRFLRPDLVPETYTTEALGEALAAAGEVKGKAVLLARAETATPALAARLREAGARVEEVALYRAVAPAALPDEAIEALRDRRADWITFTSSSTVENFLALAGGADLSQAKLAAIGPVTAETLRGRGLAPTVVAEPHTAAGLVEAIAAHEGGRARAAVDSRAPSP